MRVKHVGKRGKATGPVSFLVVVNFLFHVRNFTVKKRKKKK